MENVKLEACTIPLAMAVIHSVTEKLHFSITTQG